MRTRRLVQWGMVSMVAIALDAIRSVRQNLTLSIPNACDAHLPPGAVGNGLNRCDCPRRYSLGVVVVVCHSLIALPSYYCTPSQP